LEKGRLLGIEPWFHHPAHSPDTVLAKYPISNHFCKSNW
jgi:hypothetical protein